MEISDIQGIGRQMARLLAEDGWTISKLATVAPARLERYPFVSPEEARSIVVEAQKLINQVGEQEARPPQVMIGSSIPPATPPVRESERIRRIREGLRP